jgi:hypothetical protein
MRSVPYCGQTRTSQALLIEPRCSRKEECTDEVIEKSNDLR